MRPEFVGSVVDILNVADGYACGADSSPPAQDTNLMPLDLRALLLRLRVFAASATIWLFLNNLAFIPSNKIHTDTENDMKRNIVQIDEEKCNGCGLCVPACAEGAISIVNGKARLAADNLCDGLGACLGDCPQNAITIIEREAAAFDEVAVEQLQKAKAISESLRSHGRSHGGCPGTRAMQLEVPESSGETAARPQSRLGQWPVQLCLVPTTAPYFQDADLLITADCVPFAYAKYHEDFLAGKAVVVGCPKLDDIRSYREKLTELFRASTIKSITVLRMEVPCCSGIVMVAREALAASGKNIPFHEVTITIRGEIKQW